MPVFAPFVTYVLRDAEGYLALSSRCTHTGCIIQWNAAERTLDCPCHGSRFEMDGRVKAEPAGAPLPRRPLCRLRDGTLAIDLTKFTDDPKRTP